MKLTAPAFWYTTPPSLACRLLRPFCRVTAFLGQRRQEQPSITMPVPVICCGNISVGGTGKTPLALHLLQHLIRRGYHPHVLTRGHGGRSRRTGRVQPERDDAIAMGDETMLLARLAPTWRGPDRKANAQAAVAQGADCLVMDDGLQDPALHKDLSFLTIDGPVGLGNGQLLPAGPLRESLPQALPRLDAVVIFGPDRQDVAGQLPPDMPVLTGHLIPTPAIRQLAGRQVVAFAGIGRPEKFFDSLRDIGLAVIRTLSFPDHHIYRQHELRHLAQLAHAPDTVLVTTEKDSVKLPATLRPFVTTITIEPRWNNPALLETLLDRLPPPQDHRA